jgi:hypothetical protein
MKFTPVNEMPKSRTSCKVLDAYFKEFMCMNVKIVKVDFTDHKYRDEHTAVRTLKESAQRRGYPIDVHARDGEVYFVRRDM